MGLYINPPEGWPQGAFGKREYLLSLGAVSCTISDAVAAVNMPDKAVIVWVDNHIFEAAAYAYSAQELEAFTYPGDYRTKEYFILPKKVAEREAK